MRGAFAVVVAIVTGGCGGAGEVHLRIDLDPGIVPASVAALHIEVAAESFAVDVPVPAGAFDGRQARVVYRARSGDSINLAVTSRDADGARNGYGVSPTIVIPASGTVDGEVLVEPASPETADLAVPSDGALDAGADGGGSTCAALGAGVLFCDGFEGLFPGTVWSNIFNPVATQATVMADSSRVFRGAKALHFRAPAQSAPDGMTQFVRMDSRHDQVFGAPALHGRVFFYLPSPLPANASGGAALFSISNNTNSVLLGVYVSTSGFVAYQSSGLGHDFDNLSALPVPLDRWVCLEIGLEASADGGVSGARIWVDDAELLVGAMGGFTAAPAFNRVSVGYASNFTGPVPLLELWFDEVIVDGKRIGCSQ